MLQTSRVIELGAGLAVPSLACHVLGAPFVVATDVEERISLIESNLRLNSSLKQDSCTITTAALRWGDLEATRAVGAHSFDVVLCSDVLFSDAAIDPLVDAIDDVASRTAVVRRA